MDSPISPLLNSIISKKWIVQKFGGTSVGKFASVIATDITCSCVFGKELIHKGAADSALIKESTDFIDIIAEIRNDHIAAAKELISDEGRVETLTEEIIEDCNRLSSFLSAAQVIEEITPKTKDVIVGVGEILSCRIIAELLKHKGVDAQLVNLQHIIPVDYKTSNDGLDEAFYQYVSSKLADEIESCKGKVPIVTGFFGIVPGSLLNQIGRGYTDLCAALLAVGLDADELQIWKEVDGIFTADPTKVATARLLPSVTPEEAAELTFFGSEILHPFTMERVIRARIPIRIKNVENPMGNGTVIFPDIVSRKGQQTPVHPPEILQSDLPLHSRIFAKRKPTAVTVKNKIVVLNIHSNRKTLSHGFLAKIFNILDRKKLVVDLISTSEVHVSMALHAEIQESDIHSAVQELEVLGCVDVLHGMTILSLVGKQMKNMVGIAAKMFQSLAQANINIEMISQGASEINISCIIDEKDAVKALNVIHLQLLGTAEDEGFCGPCSTLEKKPWLFR